MLVPLTYIGHNLLSTPNPQSAEQIVVSSSTVSYSKMTSACPPPVGIFHVRHTHYGFPAVSVA